MTEETVLRALSAVGLLAVPMFIALYRAGWRAGYAACYRGDPPMSDRHTIQLNNQEIQS